MAKYETMLITSAALDEEATAALVGKFKTLIEANGTIDSIDEWGKRLNVTTLGKFKQLYDILVIPLFKSLVKFPLES